MSLSINRAIHGLPETRQPSKDSSGELRLYLLQTGGDTPTRDFGRARPEPNIPAFPGASRASQLLEHVALRLSSPSLTGFSFATGQLPRNPSQGILPSSRSAA